MILERKQKYRNAINIQWLSENKQPIKWLKRTHRENHKKKKSRHFTWSLGGLDIWASSFGSRTPLAMDRQSRVSLRASCRWHVPYAPVGHPSFSWRMPCSTSRTWKGRPSRWCWPFRWCSGPWPWTRAQCRILLSREGPLSQRLALRLIPGKGEQLLPSFSFLVGSKFISI